MFLKFKVDLISPNKRREVEQLSKTLNLTYKNPRTRWCVQNLLLLIQKHVRKNPIIGMIMIFEEGSFYS